MRVTSASANASSLVASAASFTLKEPVRSEPGIIRILGEDMANQTAANQTAVTDHAVLPLVPAHPRLRGDRPRDLERSIETFEPGAPTFPLARERTEKTAPRAQIEIL